MLLFKQATGTARPFFMPFYVNGELQPPNDYQMHDYFVNKYSQPFILMSLIGQ